MAMMMLLQYAKLQTDVEAEMDTDRGKEEKEMENATGAPNPPYGVRDPMDIGTLELPSMEDR